MDVLINLFTLLLTVLVLENAVFSRALDITALLVIPFGRKGIWLFGLVLTAVTTLSSLIAGTLNPFIGKWEQIQYLRPVLYIVVLAALYGVVCALLDWRLREWFRQRHALLTLSFFNCAAYGAMALTVYGSYSWQDSAIHGFGTGLSFLLAVFLMQAGRRCIGVCNLPKEFKGLPAELVYVGIISLSLYGLVGHQLAA